MVDLEFIDPIFDAEQFLSGFEGCIVVRMDFFGGGFPGRIPGRFTYITGKTDVIRHLLVHGGLSLRRLCLFILASLLVTAIHCLGGPLPGCGRFREGFPAFH